MAWAHRCWRLTLGAWALSQASSRGISAGESGSATGFLLSAAGFPCQSSTNIFPSSTTDDT